MYLCSCLPVCDVSLTVGSFEPPSWVVTKQQPAKRPARLPAIEEKNESAEEGEEAEEEQEQEQPSKRIILCMNLLRDQMEELMKAAKEKAQAKQAVQQQPGRQGGRGRATVGHAPGAAASSKPFTWHSPKVVLEPKREICFPLPVPHEWSVGPRQRVKLEWDVRVRQGTAMTGYARLVCCHDAA